MKQNLRHLVALFLLILVVGACSSNVTSNKKDKESHVASEKFELLDLVDDFNEVSTLHDLLNNNQVVYGDYSVVEWRDGLGSDYEFSDGKIVSGVIYEGDSNVARKIFNDVDSVFNSKYKLEAPLMANEWDCFGELPCMKYMNLFNTGARKVSVGLYVYSKDQDENKATKTQVIVTLGGNNI